MGVFKRGAFDIIIIALLPCHTSYMYIYIYRNMYSPFFMVFFFKFDMTGECTVQVIGVLQLHMILLTTPNRCNEDCENTFYLLVISNRNSPVLGISMKLILMKLNTIKKFVHYKGIYSYITSCKATKYLVWVGMSVIKHRKSLAFGIFVM